MSGVPFAGGEASHVVRSYALKVFAAWLLIALALGAIGYIIGARTILPGPSSKNALLRNEGEALAMAHGIPTVDTVVVLLSFGKQRIDDEIANKALEDLIEKFKGVKRSRDGSQMFTRIQTKGHTWFAEEDEIFISKDRSHLVLRARTSVPLYEASEEIHQWQTILSEWRALYPDFRAVYLSSGSADDEVFDLIHRDLDHSLIYTIPLTFLILIRAFGSIGAAIIPLGVALVSLVASLGLAAIVSHISAPISATANQLVVLLVLAVGVDYSLFIVSRLREEISRGIAYAEAVRNARGSAGVAVVWSGVTVTLSLLGLLLMRDTVLTSMALVSVFAVSITVASSVIALPAFLLLVPRLVRPAVCKNKLESAYAGASIRYPLRRLFFASIPLFLVAAFATQLKLGSTMERELLPRSMQSAQAFKVLQEEFPSMTGSDISLIIKREGESPADIDEALQPFFDAFRQTDRIEGPFEIDRSQDGVVTRYRFAMTGTANDVANHALLHKAREQLVPEYIETLGMKAFFSGNVPYVVDETERYLSKTGEVFLAVLLTSMVFLLLAFRSVVVPLKAVLLNILSTAASFGVLVVVFQSGLIPAWTYGVIEGFVPALLFSILFGLSMDYHVFLLARIREEVDGGKTTGEAIVRALQAAGPTITNAALIMASVFIVIASLELPIMKQLGVGLAVAVIIDATLIRSVLLPASMMLLGRMNWYLPRWLEWLPRIGGIK